MKYHKDYSVIKLFNKLVEDYPCDASRIITKLFMTLEIGTIFPDQEVSDKLLDTLYEYYCDSDYNIAELFEDIDLYYYNNRSNDNGVTLEDYLKTKDCLD